MHLSLSITRTRSAQRRNKEGPLDEGPCSVSFLPLKCASFFFSIVVFVVLKSPTEENSAQRILGRNESSIALFGTEPDINVRLNRSTSHSSPHLSDEALEHHLAIQPL